MTQVYIEMADGSFSRWSAGIEALEEKLAELKKRGYNPKVVVMV